MQPEASEIVVVDCSRVDPATSLGPLFPGVRFVHYQSRTEVPVMRWSAVADLKSDLIAAVEARCVPASDWCATLLSAHRDHPDVPAIGGPVSPPLSPRPWELGLFFSEYGRFAPPLPTGVATELSGANLSYKRSALLSEWDLIEAGRWETLLHLRWLEQGKTFYLAQAPVRFENTMTIGEFLRQRFSYGRGYASDRIESSGIRPRIIYAFLCIALPFLLTFRLGRAASHKGLGRRFARCLGWVLLFQTAWTAGEFAGYVAGPARKPDIY